MNSLDPQESTLVASSSRFTHRFESDQGSACALLGRAPRRPAGRSLRRGETFIR